MERGEVRLEIGPVDLFWTERAECRRRDPDCPHRLSLWLTVFFDYQLHDLQLFGAVL